MTTTLIAARAYTLAEVDSMREAIAALEYRYIMRSENQSAFDRKVENQLRTYMMAGVEPFELEAKVEAERQRRKEYAEESKRMRTEMERGYDKSILFPGFHRPFAEIDRDIAAARKRNAQRSPRN